MNPLRESITTSESDKLVAFLKQYVDRCWEGRQQCRQEKHRLLYRIGTIFVTMIIATGAMHTSSNTPFIRFTFIHCISFHTIGAIVYFFYLYIIYKARIYDTHGEIAEQELKKRLGMSNAYRFYDVAGHWVKYASPHVQWLVRLPNVLIVLIYLSISIIPVTRVGFEDELLTFTWQGVASIGMAIAVLFSGYWLYRRACNSFEGRCNSRSEDASRDIVACILPDDTCESCDGHV